jgi:hypothetical protein
MMLRERRNYKHLKIDAAALRSIPDYMLISVEPPPKARVDPARPTPAALLLFYFARNQTVTCP